MTGHMRLYDKNKAYFEDLEYKMLHHNDFDYTILSHILCKTKSGKNNTTYSDCFIMADTETSKKNPKEIGENHVCAWTISIRSFDMNIVTLWGRKPSTLIETLSKIKENLYGYEVYVYFHNLAYDYVFLRKFLYREFGKPDQQLNVKSHYPLYIHFHNGLILKDSLILAQRKLEKWAIDLNVEHKKAVGMWDYNKIRNQNEDFTDEELTYIEHDTLSGVECLDTLKKQLNKMTFSMPYTATGIPREEVRKRGKLANAHNTFLKMALSFDEQMFAEDLFHGGYVHANRHYVNTLIKKLVQCFDFSSSYPFNMLARKFPSERFTEDPTSTIEEILKFKDEYAYMFTLILVKPRLKSDDTVMPVLQYSKCTKILNPVLDNGRVLCAAYVEIKITEVTLGLLTRQYDFDAYTISDCRSAAKDYLPRWFTDYVYELYRDKCTLKHSDPILYAIQKAKLNSLYGMCVQKPLKNDIEEDYDTGEFNSVNKITEENYEKWLKKRGNVLNYQTGVWVTEYAMENLFELGKCVETWLYSDTDSCYGIGWDLEKVAAYNEKCKKELLKNGYGAVTYDGKEYWLGIAEHEELKDDYSEFIMVGAKRYAGRCVKDGEIHITVAGVPKNGAVCLNNDLNNFKQGFIFDGKTTGKKQHTYFFNKEIYIDPEGNETGDSINLSDCNYELDPIEVMDWKKIWTEEIEVQVYD